MSMRKNRKRTDRSGSTFDSFLEQEGIREEVEAVAIKRVLAWQLEQAMQEQQKKQPSDGKAAPHEPVATGSPARPSERLCNARYDHAGSQGAWQARHHSCCRCESQARIAAAQMRCQAFRFSGVRLLARGAGIGSLMSPNAGGPTAVPQPHVGQTQSSEAFSEARPPPSQISTLKLIP